MGGVRIQVLIQYVEGCPHYSEMFEMVASILDTGKSSGVLKTALVSSVDQAEELGFVGSPTLLIDGVDPFADQPSRVGLACRIYGSGKNRSGVPPKAEMEAVLLAG